MAKQGTRTNGLVNEAPYATESDPPSAESSPQTVLKQAGEKQLAPWEKHDIPKPRGKGSNSAGTSLKAKAPFATEDELEQGKMPLQQMKAPWDRDETVFLGKGGTRKLGSSLAPYAVE